MRRGAARDKADCMNATQNSGCASVRPLETSRLARLTGIALLLVGGVFMCSAVDAGSIYKCPLPNGTWQYTDVSCSGPRASVVHVNTKLDNETRQTGGDRQSIPARFHDGQGEALPADAQARRGETLYSDTVRQYRGESAKLTRSDLTRDLPDDQRVPTHVLQAGGVPPSAYECIAGPKHWIQTAPCPQVNLKDPRDTTDDDPSLNSEPERGSYVLLERVPVRQQPLDKLELCRKLDDNTTPIEHNGSSDVYERNVARAKYCP